MSLDYVEIELDRPRKVRFTFRDLRDLEVRLGGIPFQDVLDNLAKMHLNTLVQTLTVGLRWDDQRIAPGKVDELINVYLSSGNSMADLLGVIAAAMEISGITGRPGGNDDRPTT